MSLQIARSLPLGPTAPRAAREVLTGLAHAVAPTALETLRLIVSELVTNSYKHSGMREGDLITLRVRFSPKRVRVEVEDKGPTFDPPARPADPLADEGRGMTIVGEIADRWGVERKSGKVVWAEVAVGPDVPQISATGLPGSAPG